MQITPSVLNVIMFNDLAVKIKIYLKVFIKKRLWVSFITQQTEKSINVCWESFRNYTSR